MGAIRGSNSGIVSGILSLQAGQQFTGHVYEWSRSYSIPVRKRGGRGGPRFEQTRRLNAGSNISFRMQGTGVGFPCPAPIYNSTGTIVLQYDGNKQVTLTGDIVKYEESFNGPKRPSNPGTSGENWDIGVVMNLSIDPTYSGWPGTQSTPSAQTPADQETDVGLMKHIDPNALQTTAERNWDVGTIADTNSAETFKLQHFLGSASPISIAGAPLKVIDGSLRRTDRAGVNASVRFGLRSTADDVTFPKWYSTRDGDSPFIDTFPQIYTSAATVANLANVVWGQFQSIPYAKGITVTPLTDNKKLVLFRYRNIGYLIRTQGRVGPQQISARVVADKAQLKVQSIYTYTAGRTLLVLSREESNSAYIREFMIFRQIVGTTIPENSSSTINGINLPDPGQINSASFLGIPAKTVVYKGVKAKVNLGLTAAGNLSMFIGYGFYSNSLGIINGIPTGIFNRRVVQNITATNTGPGWYDADSIGFPDIVQPTAAGFTAFNSLP